jgi:hypothetical protein
MTVSNYPLTMDHDHSPFSWYISDRKGVFNPYNVSDRISRKTWYNNVTHPDKMRGLPQEKLIEPKIIKVHVHNDNNSLFTRLNCPECYKAKK